MLILRLVNKRIVCLPIRFQKLIKKRVKSEYIPIFSKVFPCCGTKITHKSNKTEVARKHSRPARRCFIEYRWNSRSRTSFGKDTSDEIAVGLVLPLSSPLPLSPFSLTSAQPFPFAFVFSAVAFILSFLSLSVCVCVWIFSNIPVWFFTLLLLPSYSCGVFCWCYWILRFSCSHAFNQVANLIIFQRSIQSKRTPLFYSNIKHQYSPI